MIMFEKSDLANASRHVYSHEIRQLFLTQNQGSSAIKNRETPSKKLTFGCKFDKGKNIHNLFLPLKEPLLKYLQHGKMRNTYIYAQYIYICAIHISTYIYI